MLHRMNRPIAPAIRFAFVPFMVVFAVLFQGAAGGSEDQQGPPLTEKTLVAWAAPANLTQRGGSALTLGDGTTHFDGVVFGELAEKRWMAGSDLFQRTQRQQEHYPPETADQNTFVQLATVYQGTRVTLYRNGVEIASYEVPSLQSFGKESFIVIGPRHVGKDDAFAGKLEDARIYDVPLSREQLTQLKPDREGEIHPWAWWTFDDALATEKMGRLPHVRLTQGAAVSGGQLHLDGIGGLFAASTKHSAQAIVDRHGNRAPQAWLQPPSEAMTLLFHLQHPGGDSMPGDPNPAFAIDGKYHLHYILGHPWRGQTSFSFVHVTSPDMLHWTWQPTQLQPAHTGHGMFSGTGFLTRDGRPAAIYHGQASGRNQIAIAKDNQLSGWEKPFPINAKNADGSDAKIPYWDPDCFLIGDTYYAISGGENPPLMKSKDLKNWTLIGNFLAHDMPDVAIGEDVSCPNFFKLGDKWMLLCISHPLGCRYYLGDWDSENEQFVPTSHGRMNWRRDEQPIFGLFQRTDFFAPESVLTPDGRRVMWAWLTSLGPNNALLNKTIQSLPRELRLPADGVLRIEPIRELETLRYDAQRRDSIVLDHPITGHTARVPPADKPYLHRIAEINGEATELRIRIAHGQAARKLMGFLLFSDGKGGGLPITLRPENGTLRVGTSEAPFAVTDLPAGEDVELRIFIDKYLVEVFANGRHSIVAGYLGDRSQVGIDAFTVGAPTTIESLEQWKLRPTTQGFVEATKNRVWAPLTE